MALTSLSCITYGLEVTSGNRSLDFKLSGGGAEKQATLQLGYYDIDSLALAVASAMSVADNSVTYTVTSVRYIGGGARMNISSSSPFLSLLFSSGSRNASACGTLLGLGSSDKTGATSYLGTEDLGTKLIPEYVGYNYIPSNINQEVQGSRSVSANGTKEAIVFQIQKFIQVEFKYIKKADLSRWTSFIAWAIRQRSMDFTPEITNPSVYFAVTLDGSTRGQGGMGIKLTEQLPNFPNYYSTGQFIFRETPSAGDYII